MRLAKVMGLAAVAVVLCAVQAAQARTQPAAAGRASVGALDAGFNATATGIQSIDATVRTLVIPIALDFPGFKTLKVRGDPSGVTCTAIERGAVPVPNSAIIPVTAPGTHDSGVRLPQPIVAGNGIVVLCTFTNTTGRVLIVDYNP